MHGAGHTYCNNHDNEKKDKSVINFRDFQQLEQEEEQDIVPDEPEVRISREELLARYQVCQLLLKRLNSMVSFQ